MLDYWKGKEEVHTNAITRLKAMRDLAKAEKREEDNYLAKKEITFHSIELSTCREAIRSFQ